MARISPAATRLLVFAGCLALALAKPNYWKHCDATEPTSCTGVTVPSAWDPTTFVASSDATWSPTCCKLDMNPAMSQYGFYCFADSNAPDNCPVSQLGIQGTGDPLMAGFDGHTFMFDGQVGNYYNILSDTSTQITGHFTAAHMWDHNGTYITTMGVKYKNYRIKTHVVHDGSLEVEVNDRPLMMPEGAWKKFVELVPTSAAWPEDNVNVTWQYYRKGYGHSVEVTTPLLTILIWSSLPEPDQGGVLQPAYLNFKTSLRHAPEGDMHGILGQSYERAVQKAIAEKAMSGTISDVDNASAPDFEGNTEDYAVPHLFSDEFYFNRFGSPAQEQSSRRLLAMPLAASHTGARFGAARRGLGDSSSVHFPLHAQGAGIAA